MIVAMTSCHLDKTCDADVPEATQTHRATVACCNVSREASSWSESHLLQLNREHHEAVSVTLATLGGLQKVSA